MIAVIEQQKVQRRKPAKEQGGGARILEFTYPGQRRPPQIKRSSWRTVQRIRRPPRRAVLRTHAIPRAKAPAAGKPFRIRGLLENIPRADLILAAAAALCVLIPLGFRLPFLAPAQGPIELPTGADIESVMVQYLIPEGQGEVEPGTADQKILDSIRTTSYTVRNGDTISGIAQRFNLSMDTVISFNDIQDARSLNAGMILTVPNSNGLKYKVKRGDYLGGIAKKFDVALNDLLDWNNLETSVIVPGQELFIPNARLSEMERNRVFGRLFIYPTKGRITDRFGMRRDPFTGMRRFHNGVDLAGPVGTPVVASMSGKVAMVGYNPTYGKYLILTHPEGFQTLYGHLDAFRVQRGEGVKQGQRIADMGNSGYSTGSHLHFSIFRRGEPIDPFQYLH
ncbi:MAG: M23 family metallopeptidase [Spirochaetales bacterium]|nr:M23 family metallopeptidase [Spirochaetales bacterium]